MGLAPALGNGRALRVLWQQDAAAAVHLPKDLRDAQHAAMHQALRTILAAHQLWIVDGPLGVAPLVRGLTRPGG
ncbi:hypothetical protein [Streptomyces sp. NPDC055287]